MQRTQRTITETITRVGALTLAFEHTESRPYSLPIVEAQDTVLPHIFDSYRLRATESNKLPSPLLAQFLLDAADHCETCRAQLDQFLTCLL